MEAKTAWVYQISCARLKDSEEHQQNLNTQQRDQQHCPKVSKGLIETYIIVVNSI